MGLPPALIRLPRTGLLARFDTSCTENDEGELTELYGTAPDYCCGMDETPITRYEKKLETVIYDKAQ